MVTRAQFLKLSTRVEDLAGAFDPHPVISVAVFDGETEDFAAKRHVQLRPEHKGQLVRFDHRGAERSMTAEAFAVWAGATEEDAIELRQWMERRAQGPRNFLDFYDIDGDDIEESLEDWERDYRGEMAAAGLSAPHGYADVPQPAQH